MRVKRYILIDFLLQHMLRRLSLRCRDLNTENRKDNKKSKQIKRQGQTVRRTEVIDKSDKLKSFIEIRQTYLHTEKRADRKIIRKVAL